MAKKTKNNPEPELSTPAPAAAPAVKVKKQQSLFKLGLAYAIVAIALLLLVQVGALLLLKHGGDTQRQALAELELKHYQSVIDGFVRDREKSADALVADPAPLLAALASGSVTATEAQLLQRVPGATQVRLSPAVSDPSAPSTLSFALQDMVSRAVSAGKALPPELSYLNNAKVVTLARTVAGPSGVAGVVLVSYPFKPLNDELVNFGGRDGKLELGQGFGADKSPVIASNGDSVETDGPLKAHATRNPNWELRFAPAKSLGQDAVPFMVFLPLLLAAVLVVAVLFLLVLKRLEASLNEDLVQIDNFNENFLRFGQRAKPALTLSNFGNMLFHLEQYAAELRAGKVVVKPHSPDAIQDELASLNLLADDSSTLLGGAPAPKAAAPTQKSGKPAGKAAAPLRLPAQIFRAYDIRGKAGSELSIEVVRLLGLAIGSEVAAKGEQTVIVGRDARLSSPELIKALIDGLQASGRDVIDVGTVPTPVLYFATKTLGPTSGVMLTGSHNPAEDNGLKIVIAGHTLAGDEIKALKTRVENQDFVAGSGGYSQQNVSGEYIERVASDVVLARPFRVVVDGGNGVAGLLGVRVLEALGCKVVPLFCEPDGSFPNHHPDPAKPENLEDLQSAVASNEAQLGIAFDGDGDRIGIVTPAGKVIYTDRLMMLLAKHVLVSTPGADVVFDVKCSRDLVNVITANGGRPVMNRTGHSYLKAKLAETGAPLAGEMSGHIIFNDRWYGFDDALYAAARVLEILSMEAGDADAVFAEFPESISTPELSIPVEEEFKQPFMNMLVKKAQFKDGTLNTLDGVRVDFPDGWGLVRASNTTASLVARFEGRDEAAFARIKKQFREVLLSLEPGLELPF